MMKRERLAIIGSINWQASAIRHSSWAGWLALLTMVLSAAGCGGNAKLEVTGKLTKKGQPYQPPPMMMVTLNFVPEKKDSEQAGVPASFNKETGTYSVELPPGQYKTILLLTDRSKGKSIPQKIPPAFSKTVYDITSSKMLDLDIDP